MTIEEAIELIELHQKWRRGAEIEMQNPKQIGIAIDILLNFAKTNSKNNSGHNSNPPESE